MFVCRYRRNQDKIWSVLYDKMNSRFQKELHNLFSGNITPLPTIFLLIYYILLIGYIQDNNAKIIAYIMLIFKYAELITLYINDVE